MALGGNLANQTSTSRKERNEVEQATENHGKNTSKYTGIQLHILHEKALIVWVLHKKGLCSCLFPCDLLPPSIRSEISKPGPSIGRYMMAMMAMMAIYLSCSAFSRHQTNRANRHQARQVLLSGSSPPRRSPRSKRSASCWESWCNWCNMVLPLCRAFFQFFCCCC